MANHKSAIKRAKQSEKRRLRNKSYLSSVRTAVKKFKLQLEDKEIKKDDLKKTFSVAQASVAKAASKGLLHKNTARRIVGRLATRIKSKS